VPSFKLPTPTERARNIEIENRPGHPLVGCAFIIRNHERKIEFQGYVRAILSSGSGVGDLALVHFFDGMLGQALVPVTEMTGGILHPAPEGGREWIWFENDEHLRSYVDPIERERREEE
jgi:hypothetical protein